MTNPLRADGLPRYGEIEVRHVEPAVLGLIEEHRARVTALLDRPAPTFAALIEPLEAMNHELARVWSPVENLNSVLELPGMREAYNTCRIAVADWTAELGQNERLYAACRDIASKERDSLPPAARKLLSNLLRDFRLAGVTLTPDRKLRYRELQRELATLHTRFEENVLDATEAWSRHVTDGRQLAGIPEWSLARAASAARERGLEGWFFTLDQPNYQAIVMHADDGDLRRGFYEAWTTRASDQGPDAGRFDNTECMERILALRHELACLLDYRSFAEMALATRMATSTGEVTTFLHDLAARYRPAALREFAGLEEFAGRRLDAWDVAYFSEKLRQQRFSLSQEALRPWFPLTRVLAGLFEVASQLYGIRFEPRPGVTTWHPDVLYYALLNTAGEEFGGFYLDPFARSGKRGGAWMGEAIVRKRLSGEVASPIAHLVCNFTPPVASTVALLTHDDVITLFHEFGHGLHHLLTHVDYPSIAGINGVPWDAVELPSQFMEQYAWRPEVLPLISAHHATGQPLPPDMLERLLGSRTFLAGLDAVRQLEFALFDFRLHAEYDPGRGGRIREILDEVRSEVAVVRTPAGNRFAHGFTHVFSGGYAAGYYSYKWAEVLSADAFSAFEEEGVFSHVVAARFRDCILAEGGSVDAMEAFVRFRGRRPDAEALLRQDGLADWSPEGSGASS
ncbi:MAG: M3 family metallopeptidase [Steroidobacteraceae bacterium]